MQAFCKTCLGRANWQPLRELLDLSDRTIKGLLYIDEFVTRYIFSRTQNAP
jgi:hypothetical protein